MSNQTTTDEHNTSTKTEIARRLVTKIGETTKQHDRLTPTQTLPLDQKRAATPTLNQPPTATGHHGGASARDQSPPPNKARPQRVLVHSRRFWSEGGRGLTASREDPRRTRAAPLRHLPTPPPLLLAAAPSGVFGVYAGDLKGEEEGVWPTWRWWSRSTKRGPCACVGKGGRHFQLGLLNQV